MSKNKTEVTARAELFSNKFPAATSVHQYINLYQNNGFSTFSSSKASLMTSWISVT